MKGKKRSDYYIHSIKRAIQILNSFTLQKKELGVTELSKKLNLHKSTIHRILVTLEDEGLVVGNQISQKYRLGMKLFELGHIVKEIQKNGYAISIEERILGSASVAAPILDYEGKVVASLSISGPTTRFTKKKVPMLVSLVKEAAQKISVSLGYHTNT